MFAIDSYFILQVISHGDSIINMILYFTIGCAVIMLILATLLIPYFFSIENTQRNSIEFIYKTDQLKVEQIIDSCKEFTEFIEKN